MEDDAVFERRVDVWSAGEFMVVVVMVVVVVQLFCQSRLTSEACSSGHANNTAQTVLFLMALMAVIGGEVVLHLVMADGVAAVTLEH